MFMSSWIEEPITKINAADSPIILPIDNNVEVKIPSIELGNITLNYGKDFEKYGNYMPNFNYNFSTFHFFDNINREWLRQLTVLNLEYEKQ